MARARLPATPILVAPAPDTAWVRKVWVGYSLAGTTWASVHSDRADSTLSVAALPEAVKALMMDAVTFCPKPAVKKVFIWETLTKSPKSWLAKVSRAAPLTRPSSRSSFCWFWGRPLMSLWISPTAPVDAAGAWPVVPEAVLLLGAGTPGMFTVPVSLLIAVFSGVFAREENLFRT